ncbi:MAG: fumarylacetoacetate hydrolase family protein [Acidimicrobiales bacterium]
MKLARWRPPDGRAGLGVVVDPARGGPGPVEVADVTGLVPGAHLPLDLARLLMAGGGTGVRDAARRAPRVAVEPAWLLAPVPRPGAFVAIGYNYRAHAEEVGAPAEPGFPLFFHKHPSCVAGPRAPIPLPAGCRALDYEGELALVVGRACRDLPAERALEVVAGWLACDDVSARDWQGQSPTVTLGKSHEGFGPLGPWLVTPDEVGDPGDLGIRTSVNGEARQDGRTSAMVHDVPTQLAVLSSRCTLRPGDVLTTGTPAGSAQSMAEPAWLAPGDVVRVEVEGVGFLENEVVARPPVPWVEELPAAGAAIGTVGAAR